MDRDPIGSCPWVQVAYPLSLSLSLSLSPSLSLSLSEFSGPRLLASPAGPAGPSHRSESPIRVADLTHRSRRLTDPSRRPESPIRPTDPSRRSECRESRVWKRPFPTHQPSSPLRSETLSGKRSGPGRNQKKYARPGGPARAGPGAVRSHAGRGGGAAAPGRSPDAERQSRPGPPGALRVAVGADPADRVCPAANPFPDVSARESVSGARERMIRGQGNWCQLAPARCRGRRWRALPAAFHAVPYTRRRRCSCRPSMYCAVRLDVPPQSSTPGNTHPAHVANRVGR